MKKLKFNFAMLLIFVIFSNIIFAQKDNKVIYEKCEVYKCEYKGGSYDKYLFYTDYYDSKGRLEETEYEFEQFGNPKYFYNSDGLLIKIENSKYSSSESYQYNSKKQLISKSYYLDGRFKSKTFYEYDLSDRLIKDSTMTENNIPNEINYYYYNEKNQLSEEIRFCWTYKKDLSSYYWETYNVTHRYNSKGLLIESKIKAKVENYKTNRIVYEYNSDNYITLRMGYNHLEEPVIKYEYVYFK